MTSTCLILGDGLFSDVFKPPSLSPEKEVHTIKLLVLQFKYYGKKHEPKVRFRNYKVSRLARLKLGTQCPQFNKVISIFPFPVNIACFFSHQHVLLCLSLSLSQSLQRRRHQERPEGICYFSFHIPRSHTRCCCSSLLRGGTRPKIRVTS